MPPVEMRPETIEQMKRWSDRIIELLLAISLALAGWALLEIVALKMRTTAQETNAAVQAQQIKDLNNTIAVLNAGGSEEMKKHVARDDQRFADDQLRMTRIENSLDQLNSLAQTWAAIAADVAWIKARMQAEDKAKPKP